MKIAECKNGQKEVTNNMINTRIKPLLQNAADIIFPPQCLSCRTSIGIGGSLCPDCWEDMSFISDPQCEICGLPFELEAADGILCGSCIKTPPPYQTARSVLKYDDKSRNLITNFKYGDKIHACDNFAKWMARAGKKTIENSDVITPVPLHRIRLFTRRYNQSALLTNSLKKITGIPAYNELLIRNKHTRPQVGLLPKQRKENVKGVFSLNPKYKHFIEGKSVILVDDVMTTGATIEACSKILKKSGAHKVNVLTIARTVKS